MTYTARTRVQRLIGRYRGTVENQLELLQGQVATIVIEVLQADGEPANLTGKKLWWTLRKTTAGSVLVARNSGGSGIVIGSPATKGLATMTLSATHTDQTEGEYVADLWISETDGTLPEPVIWPGPVSIGVPVTQSFA